MSTEPDSAIDDRVEGMQKNCFYAINSDDAQEFVERELSWQNETYSEAKQLS